MLRPFRLTRSSATLSRALCSRYWASQYVRHSSSQQQQQRTPTTWQSSSPSSPEASNASAVQEMFAEYTMFTIDFFRRFFKLTFIGCVTLGTTVFTAFEGAHLWVENIGLAAETDPETIKWEWDKEMDRWSGGDAGGTDAGLGVKGSHTVRGAWMALNWGIGSNSSVVGSSAFSGRSRGGGLNVVEARLEFAQEFLSTALSVAKERAVSPTALQELLIRHASVLELMGTKDALYESRAQLEQLWASLPVTGVDAARTALKLGDLNRRLGDGEDALAWWARAIQLCLPKTSESNQSGGNNKLLPSVPDTTPASPLAQRTLASTLVSLSAFYATSGQLKQAEAVEESSLNLLRSIPKPPSLAASSPPEALHSLFLLHRSALLSIHLAEVQYALRSAPMTSVEWLKRAAESSERVALALTGLPLIHPDAPESKIPHLPSSETPLTDAYRKSRSMFRPASSLLRDARRSAAEAWNLMGVLYEGVGKGGNGDVRRAVECYERALGWAGAKADKAGNNIAEPGEGTLEAEWRALWGNYVRARNVVRRMERQE